MYAGLEMSVLEVLEALYSRRRNLSGGSVQKSDAGATRAAESEAAAASAAAKQATAPWVPQNVFELIGDQPASLTGRFDTSLAATLLI